MYNKKPDFDSPMTQRRWFWQWFLTNAVFNLVDVENMDADMETNFKYTVLVLGRTLFFCDRDGVLRALYFRNGGEVPVYKYQIVRYLVTNPVIGEYRYSVDDADAYAVYLTMLDRCQMACGFSDMIDTFAVDLAENDVSISMAQFWKRLPTVFTALSDNDLDAVQTIIKSVANGETNVVAQSRIQDAIGRLDGGQAIVAPLSEFTEYQQYKIGQFYAMLGVNTVWNMKRENVAAAENATNGETARYNIADIIDNLNDQLQEVNSRFGTNFAARLNVERAQEIAENVEGEPSDDGQNDDEPEEGGDNGDNSEN